MTEKNLRQIFEKTSGHCHFCGDPIKFANRGFSEIPDGHWEVDHVIQRDKGGAESPKNCLPACTRCNRLRWHRTGDGIRDLLFFGVIATKEIKNRTPIGMELSRLKDERLSRNVDRKSVV